MVHNCLSDVLLNLFMNEKMREGLCFRNEPNVLIVDHNGSFLNTYIRVQLLFGKNLIKSTC